MQLLLVAAFALLAAVICTPASATEYYISSSLGSDSNSGTDAQHPWASVQALTSRKAQLAAGDVVHLCNTDQFLAQALTFNFDPSTPATTTASPAAAEVTEAVATASSSSAPTTGGTVSIVGDWPCQQPSAPLSYDPTAFPVLSPAVRLPGPAEGRSNGWKPVVRDGLQTGLLSYDVSSIIHTAGLTDHPSQPVITAVWCGGQRLVQAREPDLLDFNHREGVDICQQHTQLSSAPQLHIAASKLTSSCPVHDALLC